VKNTSEDKKDAEVAAEAAVEGEVKDVEKPRKSYE